MVGAFFMPGEICAFVMPIFTERAEQANTALANGDISQEQYDALQREIIETEQDLKKLETQANQSATAMQKIAATGEKLKTTGDNISSAGQKLLPVTAAVTGMGAASLKTAADFESSMSQVQATMGITKDSMSTVDGQSVNTMMTIVPKISGAITAVKKMLCDNSELEAKRDALQEEIAVTVIEVKAKMCYNIIRLVLFYKFQMR